MNHIKLSAIAAIILTASPALADHPVPPYFQSDAIKMDGNKCNRSAFDESFWSKGTRGKVFSVNGIDRVCGTTRVKWQGLTVNINWRDSDGRFFTDCSRADSGEMQCWLTLPDR